MHALGSVNSVSWRSRLHLLVRRLVSRATPNPKAKQFQSEDYRRVVGVGASPLSFSRRTSQSEAKLETHLEVLRSLWTIDAVQEVLFGLDSATVALDDESKWNEVEASVVESLVPLFDAEDREVVEESNETTFAEEDGEVVRIIKQLIEEKVRPYAQGDGGDIIFDRFDERTGVLWLHMLGACASCPSSTVTLRYNVHRLFTHYVPEVKEVKRSEMESEAQFDEEWTGETPLVKR